jgi:hypothetical protein
MDNFDNHNSRDEFASLFYFQRDNKALDFILDEIEVISVDGILIYDSTTKILFTSWTRF